MQKVKATVVVPTYKEVDNLRALITRVFSSLDQTEWKGVTEMIIVDDNSKDGSEEVVKEMERKGYRVRMIVRENERGLSSAVLKGFEEAEGELLVCMDADLQHPPEAVPLVLNSLISSSSSSPSVEFVIGTRYGGANSIDKDWPLYRRIFSWGARVLSRPLTSLSDPMSGFFGVHRSVLERGKKDLSGVGFKIGLEIYVKCRVSSFSEVPIVFGLRNAGYSKLSSKVMVLYLQHLVELYSFSYSLPVLIAVFLVFVTIVWTILSKLLF